MSLSPDPEASSHPCKCRGIRDTGRIDRRIRAKNLTLRLLGRGRKARRKARTARQAQYHGSIRFGRGNDDKPSFQHDGAVSFRSRNEDGMTPDFHPRILVVDDEPDIRETFVSILEAEGYQVRGAGSLREGRRTAGDYGPHLVLLDLGLPDGSGLELLEELRARGNPPGVVIITAEKEVRVAVEAMRNGALDYLEKPIGLDRLVTTVRLCLDQQGLRRENLELRERLLAEYEILGHSAAIDQLRTDIERVANADLPVLITGENGTGKELVARRLHLLSNRYREPFLATNCAAVPEALIEAEFFGHVKGAYTGAERDRAGLFLEAGGGSLFLDEIGEMPGALQARLLRVLQERSVTPVGSSESRAVDCRIIAATNKDLAEELEAGRFREDLFYRIRGVELTVPPLRDRRDDIPLLAAHFLDRARGDRGTKHRLGEAALAWLSGFAWPGNVRQLQSVIQSAVVLVDEGEIEVGDLENLLGPRTAGSAGADASWFGIQDIREFRDAVEKEFLRRKLEEFGWNVSETARRIGIRRTNLHERLKHHGLK